MMKRTPTGVLPVFYMLLILGPDCGPKYFFLGSQEYD